MSVVLLPPHFGIHLQTDILEVHVSIHLLDVSLSDVILCVGPVAAAGKCGYLLAEGTEIHRLKTTKHANNAVLSFNIH